MNQCDHGHETRGEIWRLPIDDESAALVCFQHYRQEINYRHERSKETGADKWSFPPWDSLAVDQAAS